LAATHTPTPEPGRIAPLDGQAHFLGKVWIVIEGVYLVGAEVDDLVAGLGEIVTDFLLERKACVVGTDCEFHG
jgi:hypothetical protein